LAAALAAAHAVDVIHRDFKSQNIILVERGGETVPVVTDFGLAWRESEATVTDRFAGTPAYMAPEQVLGDAPTAATDVYALGVVAFELVSGVLPFAGASGLAIALAKTREAARSVRTVAPAVEPRWAHAIARALERDPARRWQSPGELVAALDAPAPSRRWLALALPLGLGAAVAVTALAARDGAIEIPPLRDPAGRLALQIGGLGQDIVEGVRVDRAGTLFAVGHFSAPFTFRGARLAPPVSGAQAGFAIAVAPDGGVRWTRVFGGRLDAMATAVAVTDDGDVLVGGTVRGPVDFGGAAGMLTPAGRADGFVVRLGGADGATRWVWRTGAQGAGQVRGLAVADDAVFAAGDYAGTAELGTGRVAATRADDRSGPFVVRLDRDGRPTWIHAPEGTGDGRCWRVALGDASVFAVGFFTGELGGLRAVGSADAMITRLDAATGAVRWTRAFGGAALDELGGVAYAEGRLAVTGDYGGDGRWGQTALVGGGNADLVVAELDPADGEPRWVRGFPAPDYQQGRVVGFAPDGAVRVAARMNGALTLAAPDAALPLHFDGEDVALFTFARTGAVVAARAWAGGGSARPRDMLIAPDGRVTLAGMFRALELDADQTLHAEGTADGFVLEVAP
ncbi:MAG: serine/threonine-protein kinase, partial [Deltaproteobacteria bacterium]|nr:serine/threonine-protein kinase [Deltaproteobacteria bacterium]